MKKPILQSIEFYEMYVETSTGKMQTYTGAVAFGARRAEGCEVLKILTPTPDLRVLHEQLGNLHHARLRERLIFLQMRETQVTDVLQSFCQQGLPLPNVYDDSIARLEGFSVFQLSGYEHPCRIPHGETRAYAWLASRIKKYGAERAVGGAMRSNPFPLIIPCHRVVKKDGNLGGYMGTTTPASWQLGLKKTLLEVESLHRQPSLFALPNLVAIA